MTNAVLVFVIGIYLPGCSRSTPAEAARTFRAAVNKGNMAAVRTAIARDPAVVNRPDAFGRTALDSAAAKGDLEMVKLLLESGANPNAQGPMKMTPLTAAVRAKRLDIVELLLDHGADPTVAGRDGQTPLQIALAAGDTRIVAALRKHAVKR